MCIQHGFIMAKEGSCNCSSGAVDAEAAVPSAGFGVVPSQTQSALLWIGRLLQLYVAAGLQPVVLCSLLLILNFIKLLSVLITISAGCQNFSQTTETKEMLTENLSTFDLHR